MRRVWVGLGLGVAGTVAAMRLPAFDRVVGTLVRGRPSPKVERFVIGTTDLGSMYMVLAASGVTWAAGHREVATDVMTAGSAAWLLAQALKSTVDRPRPYEMDGVRRIIRPPTGTSFPSGHAAVATAVMSVMSDHLDGRRRAALAATGAWVPITRIYAGVHYPSDVMAGAGMGLLLAAAVRTVRTLLTGRDTSRPA